MKINSVSTANQNFGIRLEGSLVKFAKKYGVSRQQLKDFQTLADGYFPSIKGEKSPYYVNLEAPKLYIGEHFFERVGKLSVMAPDINSRLYITIPQEMDSDILSLYRSALTKIVKAPKDVVSKYHTKTRPGYLD